MAVVELRVTVLDHALDPSAPMWGDATGGWQPAAVRWLGVLAAAGVPVTGTASPPEDVGGLLVVPDPDAWPDVVERANSDRRPLVVGEPPGTTSELLACVVEALGAVVRPDLRGVLVLRLDDPGASVRAHLDTWAHEKVAPAAWDALWDNLHGFGRASVFCCPGWVEEDGRVVPSRHRHPDEWAQLDRGVAAGVADLECHGFTHVDPDLDAWLAATDRRTSPDWYREMWPPRRGEEPSADAQASIIAAWQRACGPGTSLVAPGEAWGVNTLAAARARGFELFCSWSVCRLQDPVPTWCRDIGSPYLDEADAAWFTEGIPVVGYFHDRDMAVHGPLWFPRRLSAWRDVGARRAWAFADLAAAYRTPIDAALVDGDVVIRRAPAVPLLVERRRT